MRHQNTLEKQLPATMVVGGCKVDGPRLEAKRYKIICAELADDVGGSPSNSQWLLIQRAAGLAVQTEQAEVVLVTGGTIDIANYIKIIGSLLRVLSQIDTTRRAKDVTSSKIVVDGQRQTYDLSVLSDDELDQFDYLTGKIETMSRKS
jgi:hypothetical protein